MKRLLSVVVTLIIAPACAPTAPLVLTPEAQRITVGEADPGPGYQAIEGIEAEDGSGCGAFGTRGTFNGALNKLRYQAGQLHADFIKIISTKEPYLTPAHGDNWACFHNEYSISAIAYKKTAATEAP